MDASHPDLTGQVLDGYDPSGKGLNAHPTAPHGTQMAGLIAAHGHGDGEGAVGLAPGAKILPIYQARVRGIDAVPEDIKWAVDHQARVVNLSLGGAEYRDPKLADAIAYAAEKDVLLVVAAGNEGGPVAAPANQPGVLAVGAVDKNNTAWDMSNHGPEVMLTAPGVRIVSTGSCNGNQYCIGDGTSDATAYVSAAAALVRAKFPKLTAGQVANRLVKSAYVPSSLQGVKSPDQHYGYGIVRPYEALTQDIPEGPAQGPLAKPVGAEDAGSGGQAAGAASPGVTNPGSTGRALAADSSSHSKAVIVLAAAGGGIVFLIALIVVIATVSRRRNSVQNLAGQAPYVAQQQCGALPVWPQQVQPPYGSQAPPTGYPPQQSHQGNPYYGQGGTHP
ncbi:type VII secretion-associated serine protease mycosin [Kitasatospora cystarginea]|uniref:Type VII secretion-associated serine protease mycosin n=1 Tax=Kitasatospora cystarginea TaxID=58350 RepID=A0ABN3DUI1_9ACTN